MGEEEKYWESLELYADLCANEDYLKSQNREEAKKTR